MGISELREQYATIGSRGPVPSGFGGGLGEPQLMEHLDERFNEALDFVDEPVYRSVSTDLSWQPANDELYFDSDEPVYRSFGGFGSSTGVEDVDEGLPGSHEAWMRSMPPLVQRQSACPAPPHRLCQCGQRVGGKRSEVVGVCTPALVRASVFRCCVTVSFLKDFVLLI